MPALVYMIPNASSGLWLPKLVFLDSDFVAVCIIPIHSATSMTLHMRFPLPKIQISATVFPVLNGIYLNLLYPFREGFMPSPELGQIFCSALPKTSVV